MKKVHSLASLCVALALSLAGVTALNASAAESLQFAQNTAQRSKGPKVKVNVDRNGIILGGYDAVAYVKEGKAVKGDPEIKSVHQDATYLFASAEHKADFDKDPAKYAAQYGGFCAYGVSLGVLADNKDPNAFIVHDGKLYVCGDKGSLKKFSSHLEKNIEKADKQWLRISAL